MSLFRARALAQNIVQHSRAMSIQFKAPVRDIKFVMDEVLDADRHYQRIGAEDCNEELRDSLLEECAKFCENVLSPLMAVGDKEGCVLDPKTTDVKTPTGFKEAYEQYAAGGWQGMTVPEEFGGQGLPLSLGMLKSELIATANWSFGMFPGLAVGCMNTLLLHGSDEQKQTYLPKLADGTWLGTMCLTEPQCGTDLAQVKTKAVPNGDGTYSLTGTKIFISCGEHDFTENIVHIVLARIEGAPSGTRGISLFLVPKYMVQKDGSLDTSKKNVTCGGLESKMGIHGSSTCVMNFDNTKGFLIGEPNKGLHQMFTFMNTARVGTALQGLGAAELAYQGALPYARERLSMRKLSGKVEPSKVADPIVEHGDVRRMLLTCKAIAEGSRAIMYHTTMLSDYMLNAQTEKEAKIVDEDLGFVTPIAKAFITELGCEAANLGMQCFGGHGYIKDWGMEQNVRDARIGTLYEGTTGIQALDLLGRKILLQKGKSFRKFNGDVLKYCTTNLTSNFSTNPLKKETAQLLKYSMKWNYLTMRLVINAARDRDSVSCSAVDYLMYSGYTTMAYFWLKMMMTASSKLATASGADVDFYKSKIQTGKFYFDKLLPRADVHFKTALSGNDSVMGKDAFPTSVF